MFPSTEKKNSKTVVRRTSQSTYSMIYSREVRRVSTINGQSDAVFDRRLKSPALPSTSRANVSNLNETYKNADVPTYDIKEEILGKVLIINNKHFLKEKDKRSGSEKDQKDLKDVFKKLNFQVKDHTNLTKQDMVQKIQKFRDNLRNVGISIVIMMSHGNNRIGEQVVQGGYTQIIGSDGNFLPIDEITNEFTSTNCPHMSGKPKIFIFQCCRGHSYENLAIDSSSATVKDHADMLIAFSTLPGFYSIRDEKKGSWYIQSLCSVFKEHASHYDVEALLKMVDQKLSENGQSVTQTSSYESRGFKRCFLYQRR